MLNSLAGAHESYIWRARFRLHDRAMYVLNSLAGAHESYIWRARFRLHKLYVYVLNFLAGATESYIWRAIPVFVSFTGANIYLEAVSAGVRQLETYSGHWAML